jgi:hypothetical protein
VRNFEKERQYEIVRESVRECENVIERERERESESESERMIKSETR